MENQFFVDSEFLSPEALENKHRLETDPSSRTDHMAYLPGMERIHSDVMDKVMAQMSAYDPDRYTARDVEAALEHETCSIEDFKALLSPAAEPFLEQMAQRARLETQKHFGNTVYLFTPLYIANYCENYCIYCGFNCYNHIKRMKLNHGADRARDAGHRRLRHGGDPHPHRREPVHERRGVHRRGLQAGPEVLPHGGAGDLPGQQRRVPLPPGSAGPTMSPCSRRPMTRTSTRRST